jgi:translocation and assembly module TamB
MRVKADALDLRFLPAVAPGVVRAASGTATVDLSAAGPLGALRPRGGVRVQDGRIAVAELGEWTGAEIDAALDGDGVELRRFDVRKGKGRLRLTGTLRGLASPAPAELSARLQAEDFGVERAGMELVRLSLEGEGRGTLTRDALTLGIVLPQADVRLPKRIPRSLQEVGDRKDITVGRPKPPRVRRPPRGGTEAPGEAVAPEVAEVPFRTVVHVVAPRRLWIRAEQPRIDVELKGDVLLAFAGGRNEANGSVVAVQGQVEPIGGRVFAVERGKVTFAGGPITAGGLDIAARYDNPAAVVRATIGGTLANPKLQLTSEPPLQEAQIAMLIATGRTELLAGSGGVNTLAAQDAGLAAAGAVAMGVFKELLSDKLPVDSVSLDSTALRAGKYLTDRLYVGYVRRFEAKPERGENPDEVRAEYQLAPGWQVETRYGTGQSGSASIVWTKSY